MIKPTRIAPEGNLIHRTDDQHGVIEIYDDELTRTMYFGGRAKQSSMYLGNSAILVLSYAQAMVSSLMFMNDPRSMLLIGLGGGSLASFFLHHYPKCQIEGVESSEKVVKLAYAYFDLPVDPRMNIHIKDGSEFIRESQLQYDIEMIDAFDDDGVSNSVCTQVFFDNCRARLSQQGIMVINLWLSKSCAFQQITDNIRKSFDNQILLLPVNGHGNIIVLAFNQPVPAKWRKKFYQEALTLQNRFGIDFPAFLHTLYHYNTPLIRRMFPFI